MKIKSFSVIISIEKLGVKPSCEECEEMRLGIIKYKYFLTKDKRRRSISLDNKL